MAGILKHPLAACVSAGFDNGSSQRRAGLLESFIEGRDCAAAQSEKAFHQHRPQLAFPRFVAGFLTLSQKGLVSSTKFRHKPRARNRARAAKHTRVVSRIESSTRVFPT